MALLPNAVRRALYAAETSEDVITLVRINHPDWAEPLRFASHGLEYDYENDRHFTTHDGEEYEHALVSALLPDVEAGGNPSMPVVLDNVVADTAWLLDQDLHKATIDIFTVLKSDPEEIVEEAQSFEIATGEAVDERVTLEVALDADDPNDPACGVWMTKNFAPGLFL